MLYNSRIHRGATAIVKKYKQLNTGEEYAVKTINKKVSERRIHNSHWKSITYYLLIALPEWGLGCGYQQCVPLQEMNAKVLKREVDILLHLSHENIVI